MTTENTMTPAPTATAAELTTHIDILASKPLDEIEDLILSAMECTEEAGILLIADDAASLMSNISDTDHAAAELRELARLIEYHGVLTSKQGAE